MCAVQIYSMYKKKKKTLMKGPFRCGNVRGARCFHYFLVLLNCNSLQVVITNPVTLVLVVCNYSCQNEL